VSNESYHNIEKTLFLFMRAFDMQDWNVLLDCLCDEIFCDYSSFRGIPAGNCTKQEYVAERKTAFTQLKTQHNLFNIIVDIQADSAQVYCNYVIYRFLLEYKGSADQYFHSWGQYEFTLKRIAQHWKIASITQNLLVNEGNPAIHGALRKT
jgi:hypothetical protein